jgi:hypothetical protein
MCHHRSNRRSTFHSKPGPTTIMSDCMVLWGMRMTNQLDECKRVMSGIPKSVAAIEPGERPFHIPHLGIASMPFAMCRMTEKSSMPAEQVGAPDASECDPRRTQRRAALGRPRGARSNLYRSRRLGAELWGAGCGRARWRERRR